MHVGLNAHLLSRQAGYRAAGVHSYIHNLLMHLAAASEPDWRFTAMVGRGSPAAYAGIDIRRSRLDTESPLRRILWEQFAQPFQLGALDLYHALAFVAPLLITKPFVVTIYDLSFVHYPQGLTPARRLYLQLLTGLTCRRARRVIAISHSTARDVAETYGISPDKIDVAPCGFDAERYYPLPAEQIAAFKAARGLPERFWLFVGTLEPRKNLPTLLRAYAALPRHERLPLVIGGGKGWLYDEIFATVEQYQLGDSVHFTGFVPTDELPFWYNSAEVFLYPSVYEGFGLPVLEAMACGTPVVVSDASSLPEVAGDAGLCVPPRDEAAWHDALYRAYHDGEWRANASKRGIILATRYTWANTAAQTLASYRCAVDNSAANG